MSCLDLSPGERRPGAAGAGKGRWAAPVAVAWWGGLPLSAPARRLSEPARAALSREPLITYSSSGHPVTSRNTAAREHHQANEGLCPRGERRCCERRGRGGGHGGREWGGWAHRVGTETRLPGGYRRLLKTNHKWQYQVQLHCDGRGPEES